MKQIAGSRPAGASWLMLLLTILGCDSSVEPEPPLSLPSSFQLVGRATAHHPSGSQVDCSLDLIINLDTELSREPERVDYSGRMGGGVSRKALQADGSGLAFFADVAGTVKARRLAPDSLELEFPESQGAESRFWANLAFFAGTVKPKTVGGGTWLCAPFDLDEGGYVDTSGFAQGTWRAVLP